MYEIFHLYKRINKNRIYHTRINIEMGYRMNLITEDTNEFQRLSQNLFRSILNQKKKKIHIYIEKNQKVFDETNNLKKISILKFKIK